MGSAKMTLDPITKIERICLAKIAACEVVRDSLCVASISVTDNIGKLEHIEHDTKHLDFGLALRYTVHMFQKFDIRVTQP